MNDYRLLFGEPRWMWRDGESTSHLFDPASSGVIMTLCRKRQATVFDIDRWNPCLDPDDRCAECWVISTAEAEVIEL